MLKLTSRPCLGDPVLITVDDGYVMCRSLLIADTISKTHYQEDQRETVFDTNKTDTNLRKLKKRCINIDFTYPFVILFIGEDFRLGGHT